MYVRASDTKIERKKKKERRDGDTKKKGMMREKEEGRGRVAQKGKGQSWKREKRWAKEERICMKIQKVSKSVSLGGGNTGRSGKRSLYIQSVSREPRLPVYKGGVGAFL